MVTFEEFFEKKKIDLSLLQQDNAMLYKEFADHFEQMGAKSFDHSKKFWFNRLRKDYLLADKPVVPPVEKTLSPTVATTSVSPAEDSPATAASKPAGFKPRFKAGATKEVDEVKTDLSTESSAEDISATAVSKPAGFKPRFKAGTTKAVEATPAVDDNKVEAPTPSVSPSEDIPASTASKPVGFKPRFKAGVTKSVAAAPAVDTDKVESVETSGSPESPEASAASISPSEDLPAPTANKPVGFKPRFKAGTTKAVEATPAVDSEKNESVETSGSPESPEASAASISPSEDIPASTANKPVGFKPRFKAGVTKSVAATPAVDTDKVESVETSGSPESPEASAASISPSEDIPAPAANKPVGFKPRFKAGVTKSVAATPAVDSEKNESVENIESPEVSAEVISPSEDIPAPTANKPVGFKPRFKAGVTKSVAAAPAVDTDKVESVETSKSPESPEVSAVSTSPSEDIPAATANKPVGFKPRFKAGITKNKPTDDLSSGQE